MPRKLPLSPNPSPTRGEGSIGAPAEEAAPLSPLVGERGTISPHNFARNLRKTMTDVERMLWKELRAHRFGNLKFKRQQPLGKYVLDFVCFEKKLVIELDGGQHAKALNYDAARDDWLREQGFRVLGFWNNDVLNNRSGVLEAIAIACGLEAGFSRSPTIPPPQGGRGACFYPSPQVGEGQGERGR